MTEKKVELGTEEAVRYDRQMRLWGVEAQLSMMGSRVVLLGVDCLGSEVAKNIVLGGVGALHIVDESAVQESDFGKNFLITDPASLGAPRAKACLAELSAMNSLVRLTTSTELSFESASCVIITDRSKSETLAIMKECRKVNTPCIACMSFGMLSMCLSDFGDAFVTTLQEGGAKREHTASFPDAAGVFAGAAPLKGAAKVLKSCVACLALWEAGCTVADSIDAAHTKIAAAAQRTAETLGVKVCPLRDFFFLQKKYG